MGSTRHQAQLQSRSARAALRKGLHWRSVDPDVTLGYRKSRGGGRWLVRWYAGGKKYRQAPLGTADDVLAVGTLCYDAAVRAARDKVCALRKAEQEASREPLPTVADAIRSYVAMRDARSTQLAGRPAKSDASSNLRKHVLKSSTIAPKRLDEVYEEDLRAWRKALPLSLKRVTRVRTATNLKAALNAAYRLYRKRLPPDFAESVRLGLSFEDEGPSFEERARESQILDDAEVRAIISRAIQNDLDGDLARLIIVLAATGARFSQVTRMIVGDVQFGQSRLIVPNSRKGKRRHDSYMALRVGDDVLSALRPVCEGRSSREPLLCRWRYVQTGVELWKRDRRGPWTSSSEMTRQWKNICEMAGIEPVVPYALRHSSIVRGIRAGLPIRLVAALHDTSVVMIERHYSRWITDGLEDIAARAIIPLVATMPPALSAAA
jgi:integrase